MKILIIFLVINLPLSFSMSLLRKELIYLTMVIIKEIPSKNRSAHWWNTDRL